MIIARSKLLLATTNSGKIKELKRLLSGLPVDLLGLADFSGLDEIEESGETFAENAALKASGYARQARILTLADDSGLEVKSLGNRPGVYSARYGGTELSFADRMSLLTTELQKVGNPGREARFVCSVAVADSEGAILCATEGICYGTIAAEPLGNLGFGYDPIFVPEGFENTFGELSVDVKQKISHRARAFDQINPFLRDFIAI